MRRRALHTPRVASLRASKHAAVMPVGCVQRSGVALGKEGLGYVKGSMHLWSRRE